MSIFKKGKYIENFHMICEGPQMDNTGWICPKCGASVSPDSKVCPICSAARMTTYPAEDSACVTFTCNVDKSGECMICS